MLTVSSHIAMTKAILGIERVASQAKIATVTTQHAVAAQVDLEDIEDGVVVIVVGLGDILEMVASTEDSLGEVVRDVIDW